MTVKRMDNVKCRATICHIHTLPVEKNDYANRIPHEAFASSHVEEL